MKITLEKLFKKTVLAVCVSGVLLGSGVLPAQPMGMGGGDASSMPMGRGMGMGMMNMMGGGMGMMDMGSAMGMLDLSDEQQKKIAKIQERVRADYWQRMNAMHDVMEAMRGEMMKDPADPEAVAKAFDKMAGLRREAIKSQVQAHNEVRAVLTKEQREQMRGMMGPGMGMMEGGMGMMMGRGMGRRGGMGMGQ